MIVVALIAAILSNNHGHREVGSTSGSETSSQLSTRADGTTSNGHGGGSAGSLKTIDQPTRTFTGPSESAYGPVTTLPPRSIVAAQCTVYGGRGPRGDLLWYWTSNHRWINDYYVNSGRSTAVRPQVCRRRRTPVDRVGFAHIGLRAVHRRAGPHVDRVAVRNSVDVRNAPGYGRRGSAGPHQMFGGRFESGNRVPGRNAQRSVGSAGGWRLAARRLLAHGHHDRVSGSTVRGHLLLIRVLVLIRVLFGVIPVDLVCGSQLLIGIGCGNSRSAPAAARTTTVDAFCKALLGDGGGERREQVAGQRRLQLPGDRHRLLALVRDVGRRARGTRRLGRPSRARANSRIDRPIATWFW